MPPPRPRSSLNNTAVSAGRPNASTPMSERQQMALLMQMTSSPCTQDSYQPQNNTNQITRPRERNERCETNLHLTSIKNDYDGINKLLESSINPIVIDLPDAVQSSRCKNDNKNDDKSAFEENNLKEDDNDIYEFKINSKDPLSSDEVKSETKSSFESIQGLATAVESHLNDVFPSSENVGLNLPTQIKRSHSDIEAEDLDFEDLKKKKKKDAENSKDVFKSHTNARLVVSRHDKIFKQTVIGSKTASVISKVNSLLERKSPSLSPKLVVSKSNEIDTESEDSKISELFLSSGPKVPPLKIVIPQQNCVGDNESALRNGKAILTRNHAALPYVVTSNSNDATDKDNSRCNSPTENYLKSPVSNVVLLTEDKNIKTLNEEKSLQRVLRSSNRNCGSGNDRSSNNSSPQMQSNSPSPASANHETLDQSKNSGILNRNTSSPHTHQGFELELVGNAPSPSTSSTSSSKETQLGSVDLHPRKRKIRTKQDDNASKTNTNSSTFNADSCSTPDVHPQEYQFTNCYQMYLNIRKQIEKKHNILYPIKPRPPQGFNDYLINRRSYTLYGQNNPKIIYNLPFNLPLKMRKIFFVQENERIDLRLRHVVEKEKLGLSVEQEILRVHAKAARSLACQSFPFSVCTILKDEEVYNMITPEQEEKDRNARSRFNGRLLLSWLQDVDDKWEKIKEAMVLRHHNEAESLNAVQRMNWEVALKENEICEYKSQPIIEETHVPTVHVNDEFDILST